MWTPKWILDAYTEGDEAVRWELYMTYRDLRRCFDEMERGLEKKEVPRRDRCAGKNEGKRFNLGSQLVKGKAPV